MEGDRKRFSEDFEKFIGTLKDKFRVMIQDSDTGLPYYAELEKIVQYLGATDLFALKTDVIAPILYPQPDIPTFSNLSTQYLNAQFGWASRALDDGLIYSYNGVNWKSTGEKLFPLERMGTLPQLLSNAKKSQVIQNIGGISCFVGKNQCNQLDPDFMVGFYLNSALIPTPSEIYCVSGFIPIIVAQQMVSNNTLPSSLTFNGLFDITKQPIAGTSVATSFSNALTGITNAIFARFTFEITTYKEYQVENGTVITAFVPFNPMYGYRNNLNYVSPITGKNLLNTLDKDYAVNFGLGATGGKISNTDSVISGFIPISSGQTITASSGVSGCYNVLCDIKKNFIDGTAVDSGTSQSLTHVNGACFARFSLSKKVKESNQIEIGTIPTDYVPFSLIAADNGLMPLTTSERNRYKKVNILSGKNTADPLDPDYKAGFYLNYDCAPQSIEWDYLFVTGFIPIKPGQILKCNSTSDSSALYNGLFNSAKQPILKVQLSSSKAITGTVAGCYARFTFYGRSDANYMVEEIQSGGASTAFEPYNPISGYINPIKTVICDGDSITFGQYGTVSAPTELQNLLGSKWSVINNGLPGANSLQIAANSGASPYIVQTDFTIPSGTTPVDIAITVARNLVNNTQLSVAHPFTTVGVDGNVNTVMIDGIEGTLSSINNWDYSKFTRLVAGASRTIKAGAVITTKELRTYRNATHIIFLGANGGWYVENGVVENFAQKNSLINIAELQSQIDAMIGTLNTNNYLVVSCHMWNGLGGVGAWAGEQIFQRKYGARYVNLRDYYSIHGIEDSLAYGFLSGVYPTTVDTAAMSNGQMPPSLLYDDIHMVTAGYRLLGRLFYRILVMNGIV